MVVVLGSGALRQTVMQIVDRSPQAELYECPWTAEEFEATDKAVVLWKTFRLLTNDKGKPEIFLDNFCFKKALNAGVLSNVSPEALVDVCGLGTVLPEGRVKAAEQRAAPPPPLISSLTALPPHAMEHGDFLVFGMAEVSEDAWRDAYRAIANSPTAEADIRNYMKDILRSPDPFSELCKVDGAGFSSACLCSRWLFRRQCRCSFQNWRGTRPRQAATHSSSSGRP